MCFIAAKDKIVMSQDPKKRADVLTIKDIKRMILQKFCIIPYEILAALVMSTFRSKISYKASLILLHIENTLLFYLA